MTRPAYGTRTREIRAFLAAAREPLTLAQICLGCRSCANTAQVATVVHTDHARGFVRRTGTVGAYRYAITDAGLAALANPNLLRSARGRRTHNRRIARIASVIEDSAHA